MTIESLDHLTPKLPESTWVHQQASVIGDVVTGEDCSIWPMAVIRGDMHWIRIGDRVSVQDGAILHITHAGEKTGEGHPLRIGNDVTIGHQACLHGCTIGNEVLIGIGSTVLDGAVVPDHVIIGAGTLVPPGKKLESGYLYVGAPAKKARPLTDHELAYFKYTAANYVQLKDRYMNQS